MSASCVSHYTILRYITIHEESSNYHYTLRAATWLTRKARNINPICEYHSNNNDSLLLLLNRAKRAAKETAEGTGTTLPALVSTENMS